MNYMNRDYPTQQCVICNEDTRINVQSGKKKVYVCHNHVDEGREIVKGFGKVKEST